jgi:hypothetical protein
VESGGCETLGKPDGKRRTNAKRECVYHRDADGWCGPTVTQETVIRKADKMRPRPTDGNWRVARRTDVGWRVNIPRTLTVQDGLDEAMNGSLQELVGETFHGRGCSTVAGNE